MSAGHVSVEMVSTNVPSSPGKLISEAQSKRGTKPVPIMVIRDSQVGGLKGSSVPWTRRSKSWMLVFTYLSMVGFGTKGMYVMYRIY